MMPLSAMTHDELISYLRTVGGLTQTEETLLDRLIMALDEVEALQQVSQD